MPKRPFHERGRPSLHSSLNPTGPHEQITEKRAQFPRRSTVTGNLRGVDGGTQKSIHCSHVPTHTPQRDSDSFKSWRSRDVGLSVCEESRVIHIKSGKMVIRRWTHMICALPECVHQPGAQRGCQWKLWMVKRQRRSQ